MEGKPLEGTPLEGRETEGFEEESQVKMPFTKDDTYSQYANGVPPAKPAPRELDAEDEAAIAAVVGEQPVPGPGPEEQQQMAQAELGGAGQQTPSGGPPTGAGEGPPSERSGVMTTSSDEMVDVMQETQQGQQQGTAKLGDLTTEQATAHEQPAEAREATEAGKE